MSDERTVTLNDIRYAERLCQRTARLYRRMQWFGAVGSVIAAGATLSALTDLFPEQVSVVGGILFAIFGASLLVTRPGDKAAMNELDAKRYAAVRAKAPSLDDKALRMALDEARISDAPEIETLRDVAYNDVAREVGNPDYCVPLNSRQKLLAALA
jgi:hypothetical protein